MAVTDAVDGYPDRWEGDVVTGDGGTVHVRPIRPDDIERIEAFHARQSAESIYFRYFTSRPKLGAGELERLTTVDYKDRMAFVAILDDELIGVARYDRWKDREEAEVAFFIDDQHHGRGLATLLLEYLAVAAREAGITAFVASVLPANRSMIQVFKMAGFETDSHFADGVVEVRFPIDSTEAAQAAIDDRERRSDVRSVARLLEPESVAVIGAGRNPGSLGYEILRQLLRNGFAGPVYPVNPSAAHVASVHAYPTILDVPGRVDLAIIAVPATEVAKVVADCARARVGGLVVISAGFSESGEQGAQAEQELLDLVRRHGLRLVGPNTLGMINTDPDVSLVATFADVRALPGSAALLSQAGTVGVALLERARELDLGISSFVSVGNKADVSGNDMLRYWEEDPRTKVALLHLESFGNPHRFSKIARAVSARMPIVAVRAHRDPVGDALLAQTGIIQVDSLEELLDVGRMLADQPVPPGNRVVIITNAGSSGLITAQACLGAGLELATLSPGTVAAIDRHLLPGGWSGNPIDLTFAAEPMHYAQTIGPVLEDPGVDCVVVVYAPPVPPGRQVVADTINAAHGGGPKPVVVSFCGGPTPNRFVLPDGTVIPNFTFPDTAARAMGRAAAYGTWRRESSGSVPDLARFDPARLQEVVTTSMRNDPGDGWLGASDVMAFLDAAGFAIVGTRLAASADEAVEAAAAIGYPVVLKATGVARATRSEAGGLAFDIQNPGDLRSTYARMAATLGPAMTPTIVQAMVEPGNDLRVAAAHDPVVGPIVTLGPGGSAGAPWPDEAVRIAPITDSDAQRMIAASTAVATAGLGSGSDAGALCELLTRVGQVVDQVPELVDLRLDPVVVVQDQALVVTARVRVAPAPPPGPPAVRRL